MVCDRKYGLDSMVDIGKYMEILLSLIPCHCHVHMIWLGLGLRPSA